MTQASNSAASADDGVTSAGDGIVDRAGDAIADFRGTVDGNPLAVLLGGLALGAIAGALLPRSERETELLGPIGSRIADAARNATGAAREAGFGAFDQAGINKDAAREQVNKLIEAASAAAREAGAAAFKAVREG